MKIHHTVYCTTNILNSKFYIGKHSTYNIDDGYMGSGKMIKNAISKYGIRNFKKEIICECKTEDDAYRIEEVYICLFCIGNKLSYNISSGGLGSGKGETNFWFGKHRTEDEKKRISDAQKGDKAKQFGIPRSDETKLKISKAGLGRRHTQEARDKMAERNGEKSHMYGRRLSEETKAKMSIAGKGRVISQETRDKIAEAKKIKIDQYTLDGEFIMTHDSMSDASFYIGRNGIGISNISNCAKGKGNSAYKYKWKLHNIK